MKELVLQVADDMMLGTVICAVAGAGVTIKQINEIPDAGSAPAKKRRVMTGRTSPEYTGLRAEIQTRAKGDILDLPAWRKMVASHGYKVSSASPYGTQFVREKILERLNGKGSGYRVL